MDSLRARTAGFLVVVGLVAEFTPKKKPAVVAS